MRPGAGKSNVPITRVYAELSELGCDWHHYIKVGVEISCVSIKSRGFMAYWPAPDQQTLIAVASGDVI